MICKPCRDAADYTQHLREGRPDFSGVPTWAARLNEGLIPEVPSRGHPAEICRGGSWCDCQHGQPGSTLNGQQRNDFAVYGTTLPWVSAPSAPANSNGMNNNTGTA